MEKYDFIQDFIKPMKESLLNNDFYDFTDDQMRTMWAENIAEWSERYSKKKLQTGLTLLTAYSSAYQRDWVDSWENAGVYKP